MLRIKEPDNRYRTVRERISYGVLDPRWRERPGNRAALACPPLSSISIEKYALVTPASVADMRASSFSRRACASCAFADGGKAAATALKNRSTALMAQKPLQTELPKLSMLVNVPIGHPCDVS